MTTAEPIGLSLGAARPRLRGCEVDVVGVLAALQCRGVANLKGTDGIRPWPDHPRHFRSGRSSNWYELPVRNAAIRGGVRLKPNQASQHRSECVWGGRWGLLAKAWGTCTGT